MADYDVEAWQIFADELCDELNMQYVTLRVRANLGRHFGLATYEGRLIELKPTLSTEQMIETLKHELAHIMAYDIHGESCGHDYRWKACCAITGANPTEFREWGDDSEAVKLGALIYKCPKGCTIHAIRRRRKLENKQAICRKHKLPFVLMNDEINKTQLQGVIAQLASRTHDYNSVT